jgi:hypothetical protein
VPGWVEPFDRAGEGVVIDAMGRSTSTIVSGKICIGFAFTVGLLAAGCSAAPASIGLAERSYLGARAPSASQPETRVNSSKVLSAIVFERVTGLEVDPARLVEP